MVEAVIFGGDIHQARLQTGFLERGIDCMVSRRPNAQLVLTYDENIHEEVREAINDTLQVKAIARSI